MSIKKLESIRQQINQKRSELHELAHLPLQPAEVESRVDELVEAWRDQFDLTWLGRQLADCRPIDPTDDLLNTAMSGSRVKTTALFATFMPAELRRLMVDAAMEHSSTTSPSQAERIAKQRTLEQELHALEVQEEQVVCQLEAHNVEVFRRPDFDPSIVLAVTTT